MKRLLAVITAAALAVMLAPAAQAATTYSTCKALLKVYPNGVAKTAAAASKAAATGAPKPKISAAVYTSSKKLDTNADGVVCERAPKAVTFKTEFGIVTAKVIAPPKTTSCVAVPISMDIRNMGKVSGFGMTIQLVSEFGNVVGYDEFLGMDMAQPGVVLKPNGVYPVTLNVCGQQHEWVHTSGARKVTVSAYKGDESLTLTFTQWLYKTPLGSMPYAFAG